MTFDFHTTTWQQRHDLMSADKFVWKSIKPTDFVQLEPEEDRSKPIVWEENTEKFYEIDYHPVLETIEQIDKNPDIKFQDTRYYSFWGKIKGDNYVDVKIRSLKEILTSMRTGFNKNLGHYGGVCVERTGEKFDGSHRSLVAHYLQIPEIEVKEFAFHWEGVSWEWLKRKTKAREIGLGPNYYLIDYGEFKNLEQNVPFIYRENADDRWPVIKDLIGKKVLDLGCNEGLMSIKSALQGSIAHGVDYKFVEGAWTNKLIFEKLNKRDLPITFEVADLNTYKIIDKYDTCLLLNVIYHLKNKKEILRQIRKSCKSVVMQGNLRKMAYHDRFYGIAVEDMKQMLEEVGYETKVINWRDKPIVVGI